MAGVPGGLLDQVQQHPAQVEVLAVGAGLGMIAHAVALLQKE